MVRNGTGTASGPVMFTLAELEDAHTLVSRYVPRTPAYRWPLLRDRVGGGGSVWIKHENLTPCGAFKVRGGLTYMADLAAAGALPRVS